MTPEEIIKWKNQFFILLWGSTFIPNCEIDLMYFLVTKNVAEDQQLSVEVVKCVTNDCK